GRRVTAATAEEFLPGSGERRNGAGCEIDRVDPFIAGVADDQVITCIDRNPSWDVQAGACRRLPVSTLTRASKAARQDCQVAGRSIDSPDDAVGAIGGEKVA